jgi:hypothetical protein
MCSTSPLRANLIQYSHLHYKHNPLHKITSYTESMHTSYKPITPVNQLAPRGPVISNRQLFMRFEVFTILMVENTVLWNVALYKCTEFSKECYVSIFSLFDIHDDRILLSTPLFIYGNFPRNSWILSQIYQISFIAYHIEYTYITKNHANIRAWTEKVKGTDYLKGLGIDGRWDSRTDPPSIHYICQNFVFLQSTLFPVM